MTSCRGAGESCAFRTHVSRQAALAVILAIIGVLAIIAGILYVAGAANSLHFMVGSVHKGHHLVRAAVSFVVGVALLAGAWFIARAGSNSG